MFRLLLRLVLVVAAALSPLPIFADDDAPPPATPEEPIAWKERFHYFPELRVTWRRALQWERDGAEAEELAQALERAGRAGNLPMAAAACYYLRRDHAAKAAADSLQPILEQVLAESQKQLTNPEHQWGAELLLARALAPQTSRRNFVEDLLAQFVDDDIPYNAINAAEIYTIGLAMNRTVYFKPLIDATIRDFRGGEEAQEEDYLLSLTMIALTSFPDPYDYPGVVWFYLSNGYHVYTKSAYDHLDKSQQQVILKICSELQSDWRWRSGGSPLRQGTRRMARWLVEETFPDAQPFLYAELKNCKLRQADGLWLLAMMMANDPATLFTAPTDDVLPLFLRCSYGSAAPHRLGHLFDPSHGLNRVYMVGDNLFVSQRMLNQYGSNWPALPEWYDQAVAVIEKAVLKETEPYAQIAMLRMLYTMNNPDSQETLATVAMSHLVDDYVYGNAIFSEEVLHSIGPDVVPFLKAGLALGVELEDWQMLDSSTQLLYQLDEDFNPSALSAVNEFMWKQLADDDVPQNGTAAMYYFRRWSDERELRAFLNTRPIGDEQQERYRRRILGKDER